MKHSISFNADGSTLIGRIPKIEGADRYFATIFAYSGGGSGFGGGTLTIQLSPNGGTTKVNASKPDGNALAFTANGAQNIETAYGNSQNGIDVYATLSGSTTPNVIVDLFDNR